VGSPMSENVPSPFETASQLVLSTYRPEPVVMARGRGCELWDTADRRYLDMTAGIAVCALGHGDEGLSAAISAQAAQLIHTSNLYWVKTQLEFASALCARAFPGRAFFCNSGAEANEAALKLARRFQNKRDEGGRPEIVAFDNSFHGRTLAALSVTGQPKYHDGFAPLVPGTRFVPFGDEAAVRGAIGPRTSAVILEPIQAEGGINVPPPGFLKRLRELCDEHGVVLIFDEVQTGVGRTGTFYRFEQEGVLPDVVTLAKGIAGGVPMGVMLAREPFASAFEPGTHASTFGGNPLASAAALYIQKAIDDRDLLHAAQLLGAHLKSGLEALAQRYSTLFAAYRGSGLLAGVGLQPDRVSELGTLLSAARARGLLLTGAGGRVVRFVPPLVTTESQIDEALALLEAAAKDCGLI